MADLLLQYNFIGPLYLTLKSFWIIFIHSSSQIPKASAHSFASALDRATTFCFLLLHVTKFTPRCNTWIWTSYYQWIQHSQRISFQYPLLNSVGALKKLPPSTSPSCTEWACAALNYLWLSHSYWCTGDCYLGACHEVSSICLVCVSFFPFCCKCTTGPYPPLLPPFLLPFPPNGSGFLPLDWE